MKSTSRTLGFAAAFLYLACVVAANWAIQHVGTSPFPGATRLVPVGFGLSAPAGVYFVGIAFTLRDITQRLLGAWVVLAAIFMGAALSAFISPALALASGAAFLLSELADFSIYTPLIRSGRSVLAVVLSNTVGALIDSVVFLWLAFHSLQFLEGQMVGKLLMTLAVVPVVIAIRRWLADAPSGQRVPAVV